MNALRPTAIAATLTATGLLMACGAGAPLMAPAMEPIQLAQAPVETVERDHFSRDATGGVSEENLIRLIESPVFLAEEARLGIVPVAVAYQADNEIPLVGVPETLSNILDDTGFFTVTSEVSTDWPAAGSIGGLRELAARYRCRYLLLYRHRFVERRRANGWAATYPTLVTIPFAPGRTLETAGVLEATLFDVRTGSLLFTVYERVYDESGSNIWANDRKLREMRENLLEGGADALADKVLHQINQLVAARPGWADGPAVGEVTAPPAAAPRSTPVIEATGTVPVATSTDP